MTVGSAIFAGCGTGRPALIWLSILHLTICFSTTLKLNGSAICYKTRPNFDLKIRFLPATELVVAEERKKERERDPARFYTR